MTFKRYEVKERLGAEELDGLEDEALKVSMAQSTLPAWALITLKTNEAMHMLTALRYVVSTVAEEEFRGEVW